MDPPHRAAAGLAGVAFAYLGFAPIAAQFDAFGPFFAAIVLAGLGLLLAAVGVASVRAGRGLPLLGLGFALAAAAAWGVLLLDLGRAGLFLVPHALLALGLTQATWYACLWWLGTGTRGPREARNLGLTLWVVAAGFAGYLLLVVANGFWDVVAQEALGTVGAVVAARALPEAPRTLEDRAAEVAAEGTGPLQAPLPEDEERRG